MNAPPGYFGKVASHGDFVQRGLAPAFVAGWDRWLQDSLRHSRAQLGETWLPAYLYSPLWRFALGAGVCGERAMGGVLMPSVDRVGRHFPLTLAAPIDGQGEPMSALSGRAAAWFAALERLAFSSLAHGFSLPALDRAMTEMARADAAPACAEALAGRSMFWTVGGAQDPAPLVCAGLPAPDVFCAMLRERP